MSSLHKRLRPMFATMRLLRHFASQHPIELMFLCIGWGCYLLGLVAVGGDDSAVPAMSFMREFVTQLSYVIAFLGTLVACLGFATRSWLSTIGLLASVLYLGAVYAGAPLPWASGFNIAAWLALATTMATISLIVRITSVEPVGASSGV